jgi:predicted RNA-binding Zn ribbon-like protein
MVTADQEFLLALLNTTPVVDGSPTDDLSEISAARPWLMQAGGVGTETELSHLLRARSVLQAVIHGESSPVAIAALLRGVSLVPTAAEEITWSLKVQPERELAVRAVFAWDALMKQSPGRLRPCANDECRLFLIDRSTANRARWCSMAICGNRMKARRHYQRARQTKSTSR